eukprot:6188453-Pleurochrysis_carterae.AAC.2
MLTLSIVLAAAAAADSCPPRSLAPQLVAPVLPGHVSAHKPLQVAPCLSQSGLVARRMGSQAAVKPRAVLHANAGAAPGASAGDDGIRRWFIRNRSILLLIALVVHKSATDGLTRWTRLQTAYSGAPITLCAHAPRSDLLHA